MVYEIVSGGWRNGLQYGCVTVYIRAYYVFVVNRLANHLAGRQTYITEKSPLKENRKQKERSKERIKKKEIILQREEPTYLRVRARGRLTRF